MSKREHRRTTATKDRQYVKPVPDTRPGNYYVSIVRGRRYCLALGPYPDDHARALAGVERVRRYFTRHDLDGFHACGYGTCRVEGGVDAAEGKLNDVLGRPTDEDVRAYLAANPRRAGHCTVSDPEHWPFRVVEDPALAEPCFAVIETATGARIASYGDLAPAEHHRHFRSTPSTRMDLVGTGGGRLALLAVGEPRYREGYPSRLGRARADQPQADRHAARLADRLGFANPHPRRRRTLVNSHQPRVAWPRTDPRTPALRR